MDKKIKTKAKAKAMDTVCLKYGFVKFNSRHIPKFLSIPSFFEIGEKPK